MTNQSIHMHSKDLVYEEWNENVLSDPKDFENKSLTFKYIICKF